jgi:hypothetical protein
MTLPVGAPPEGAGRAEDALTDPPPAQPDKA